MGDLTQTNNVDTLLNSREKLRKRFEASLLKVSQLPYVKNELNKLDARLEIIDNKHRNECIDLHTKTFINLNSLSKFLQINENNKWHFDDCNLISKTRIDHAILTGLSIVLINNKNNTIMAMLVRFDDCDMSPSININEYKSNQVKLRQLLANHIENNDSFLQKIRSDLYKSNSNNDDNFGQIVYGCYACKQYNNINSNCNNKVFGLLVLIDDIIMIEIGYKYIYGLQTHKSTIKDISLWSKYCKNDNDLNNQYVTETSTFTVQNFQSFLKDIKWIDINNMAISNYDNNININNKKEVLSTMCIINYQFFKNQNWDLKQIWQWRKNTFPKHGTFNKQSSTKEDGQINIIVKAKL